MGMLAILSPTKEVGLNFLEKTFKTPLGGIIRKHS